MALKSHSADEIRRELAKDLNLKAFELDTSLAGGDDVLLGYDYNSARIDIALYYGWCDDPDNWEYADGVGWKEPNEGFVAERGIRSYDLS